MTASSLIVKTPRVRGAPKRYSSSPTTTANSSSLTQKRAPKKKEATSNSSSLAQKRALKKKEEETSTKKRVTPTIMAPSSLIVKGPRVRKAPKRYSPSPTTTTFPPSSRTHKRTPKKKEKTSPKAKPTPKKITKEKKQDKKATPAIPTPCSPKTRKQKAAKQSSTRQRTLSPGSYYLYSKLEHNMEVPPFNNKLTQAQIEEIESLVSPWYTVEDLLWRLRTVRKKSMLDD